jgi:DNA-binding LacI/PurR family transcriptional regulator
MDNPSPNPRPSLRDIALALGISHVAVSLALRDSPRVSVARRAEVKAMADKLGYRPDPMLASLVAYRQSKRPAEIRSCLGWINQWEQPEALRSYKEFDHYWLGASEAAEKLGYRLEEFRWPKGKSGKRLQTILQTRGVRGLLIPPHRDGMELADFDWDQFSLVRFGASVPLRAHTVTSDQAHCSRLAYEKAHELGYRRIGYVSDERFEKNTRGHFREGYLNAQEELAPRRQHLDTLMFGANPRAQQAELLTWLQRQKPDALITTTPPLRSLVIGLGLRIPEDIAVATTSVLDGNFDTGSDQNSHEIGRVAVSTLASLILENQRGLPVYQRRILVEGRWVDGASMPGRRVAGV